MSRFHFFFFVSLVCLSENWSLVSLNVCGECNKYRYLNMSTMRTHDHLHTNCHQIQAIFFFYSFWFIRIYLVCYLLEKICEIEECCQFMRVFLGNMKNLSMQNLGLQFYLEMAILNEQRKIMRFLLFLFLITQLKWKEHFPIWGNKSCVSTCARKKNETSKKRKQLKQNGENRWLFCAKCCLHSLLECWLKSEPFLRKE